MNNEIWSDLIKKQKEEKLNLIQDFSDQGLSKAETARLLGISKQQLQFFCKSNDITFPRVKKT
tara:strand:- start:2236 stop:2424 length:189 start_codon:yes stop_codon:yes gene_type:complete